MAIAKQKKVVSFEQPDPDYLIHGKLLAHLDSNRSYLKSDKNVETSFINVYPHFERQR